MGSGHFVTFPAADVTKCPDPIVTLYSLTYSRPPNLDFTILLPLFPLLNAIALVGLYTKEGEGVSV